MKEVTPSTKHDGSTKPPISRLENKILRSTEINLLTREQAHHLLFCLSAPIHCILLMDSFDISLTTEEVMGILHVPHSRIYLNVENIVDSNYGATMRVKEFRIRDRFLPEVRDIGKTAICLQTATVSAMESAYCRQIGVDVKNNFSLINTIGTDLENPFTMENVKNYVCSRGLRRDSTDEILQVQECFIGSSVRFLQPDLMKLLDRHGPFVGGVLHTAEIQIFTSDPSREYVKVPDYIYSSSGPRVQEILSNGKKCYNHAFMVTGYGEVFDSVDLLIGRYWIAQNNWGPDFGDKGFFRIWMEVPMDILVFKSFILHPPDYMEDSSEE
ncbi:hypothetical protein M5689_008658 [Euphorbia peplus]|nr:hypothetical protein M5689_008658 [Euphorbia peplus]